MSTDTTAEQATLSDSPADREDPVLGLVNQDGTPKIEDGKRPPSDAQKRLEDAFSFFAEKEEQPLSVRRITVDVGSDDEPRPIDVVLRGLLNKEQKRIAVAVSNDRNVKKIKDPVEQGLTRQDELMVRTVAAALVSPSAEELVTMTGIPDISLILKRKFGHKPGLIVSMMSVVQELSGNADDDVRTADTSEGSGNDSPA